MSTLARQIMADAPLLFLPLVSPGGGTLADFRRGWVRNTTNVTQGGLTLNAREPSWHHPEFPGRAAGGGGSAGSVSALDLTAYQTITVEAMVYFTATTASGGLAWEHTVDGNSYNGFWLWDKDNTNCQFGWGYGTSPAQMKKQMNFPRPTTIGWHHIMGHMVMSATSALTTSAVYVDGRRRTCSMDVDGTPSGSAFGSAAFYLTNRAGGGLSFPGSIAYLAIYGRALSHRAPLRWAAVQGMLAA